MVRSNILIGIAVAVLTFSVWAYLNHPEQEPAWPSRVQGFSFSPMRANQSPLYRQYPSEAEVEADLALLSGKTHAVRAYTLEAEVLTKIPELARKHKINVTLGAWLDKRLERNEEELETLLRVARSSHNVVRVIVGNEVLLREDLSMAELTAYIERIRSVLKVPVSTAEPWHVWVKHPELAEGVDFIAVHMLPYWEGIAVDEAVDYIVARMNDLKQLFPNKRIVIAEVGWPSNGRTRNNAVASEANQAAFLRRFLDRAQKENYIYYIMEAFDQPWKRETEGAVGAYWGVFNVERNPKFAFIEPIVPIPRWYILAALSVMIAAITMAFLLLDSHTLRHRGRSFLALIAFTAATGAVWIIYDYAHQYLTLGTVLVGALLLVGMIGAILVLLAEAHEWAEAMWVRGRRRAFRPVQIPDDQLPMVSIHVPAYNEPPDMMIETLNALAALDYPRFEVLVIDNNTRKKEVWQPVAEHCARLGRRFRFFHVAPLAGYKAGALNFALRFSADSAKIIAVIDSDYLVDPKWLRDLVPQFEDPKIGLVQAPQDYRDDCRNAFKAMCFAEYRAFFYIGMITRNERNAIIQHGTMTLVRRSVLESSGGWGEWCITEDAELGLRIFEGGYASIYIPRSYGKGLMPDTFLDYKKQRFRWAYGAMQILRRHSDMLWGGKFSHLLPGQRYHFVAGWLPWIADGANLIFTLAAVAWSAAMILFPKAVDPPLLELSILPLVLFAFKAIKMIYLYRTRMRASISRTIAAGLAGLALSHTIAKAVLWGLITRDMPFFRTPKMSTNSALRHALVSSKQEWLMLAALIAAMIGVSVRSDSVTLDLHVWLLVLLMLTIPYLAAVAVSLISAFPRLPAWLLGPLPANPEEQDVDPKIPSVSAK
jgi:exo-beta-1,3-glucanase (GH17 family)/cellulose synthase/poly-beta-1,6-N-acetylglucosamine synthase-like glycosyltransferase